MSKYKNGFLIITAIVLAGMVFLGAGCERFKNHDMDKENKVTYYCPMHPTYTADKPGDCNICGMKLVKAENEISGTRIDPPARSEEKTLDEICVEYKCTMKDCPMMIKAHIKPGEELNCPVCGEFITAAGGKVIAETPQRSVSSAGKKERKLLYYRNPMNPEITSLSPMKDPMGMDYVPVYEEETPVSISGGPTVMISPERQQMIGVKTEPIRMMDLTKIVLVSGKIAYDPELVVTQEEFIQSLNAQDSIKDSPLQDVIDRAKSLTEAARSKLKLLGMNDDQINILEKTRKPETNLYLPGKGENVWAYINVYEYEIGFIKIGDSVDLDAVAYPGEKFSGHIVSISPILDPQTRTNQVRVEVENTQDKLKPEMFVNARIRIDLGQKLAVPESAVMDTGLRKIVYLSRPGDILESQEVVLGQKAEGYYVVLSGLREADVVVTSGNFLIDSEARLKSSFSEQDHAHGQ